MFPSGATIKLIGFLKISYWSARGGQWRWRMRMVRYAREFPGCSGWIRSTSYTFKLRVGGLGVHPTDTNIKAIIFVSKLTEGLFHVYLRFKYALWHTCPFKRSFTIVIIGNQILKKAIVQILTGMPKCTYFSK